MLQLDYIKAMQEIGVREFNKNISFWFRKLPLRITNRRRVVATILEGEVKPNAVRRVSQERD